MSHAPFRIQRLDHLVLRSGDPDRLIGFYVSLGCTVERRVESVGLVQLRAGDSLIDIIDVTGSLGRSGGDAPGTGGRNVDHFALRIDPFDEDALLAFCSRLGVEPTRHERPLYGADGYGPAVYIRDPDGNRVELKGAPVKGPIGGAGGA